MGKWSQNVTKNVRFSPSRKNKWQLIPHLLNLLRIHANIVHLLLLWSCPLSKSKQVYCTSTRFLSATWRKSLRGALMLQLFETHLQDSPRSYCNLNRHRTNSISLLLVTRCLSAKCVCQASTPRQAHVIVARSTPTSRLTLHSCIHGNSHPLEHTVFGDELCLKGFSKFRSPLNKSGGSCRMNRYDSLVKHNSCPLFLYQTWILRQSCQGSCIGYHRCKQKRGVTGYLVALTKKDPATNE